MKKSIILAVVVAAAVITGGTAVYVATSGCCKNYSVDVKTESSNVSKSNQSSMSQTSMSGNVQNNLKNESQSSEENIQISAATSDGILGNFTSTDINGKKINQSVFKGKKLTMVNMWATFCMPCINEMPELASINKEYAGKGFQVVGIPVDTSDFTGKLDDSTVQTAKSIISETGANYVHILPSESLMQAKLNTVTSVPETIFVDENGNQVGKSYIGARSESDWKAIIDNLLEKVQ